ITTGEGGAVIVNNPEVKRRIDRLRHHGIERAPGTWQYAVQELGWNYRLSDFQCALGIAQLAKLDQFLIARRALAACYRAEFARVLPEVACPVEISDRESAYHLFAVAIDFERHGTTRTRVIEQLAAAGIATQVHYIPLLHHPLHAARIPATAHP